jgi:O-antigen/teichoic acid export membrane protein
LAQTRLLVDERAAFECFFNLVSTGGVVKLDLEATRNVPDSFAGGDLPLDTHPIASTPVVARAVAWKALTVVVGQGCWYGSLLILANFVPPQDFGVIAVGMVLIQLAGLLLDSGTGGALIIARELDVRSLCRTVVRVSAAGLALTMLLVLLAAPIMDRFARGSDPAALRMLAPIIFLLALWIVPNALLKKALCFKRIAIVNVAAVVTASIAAVCAAILGATLWALIIRLVIFQLLLTALTWLAAADIFPRDRQDSPPTPQPGAIAFLAVGAAGFIAWQGDTLVVAASTNTTQVGLYSMAFSLAYLPLTQVSWTIGTVLFPAVAIARNSETVRRQALKALRLMTLGLLPIVPLAIALAGSLIPRLLGPEWSGAIVPFQILVVAGAGHGITNVLGEVFAGVGGETLNRRSRIDLVWAGGTLATIALGVHIAGIRGAAAAHLLTFSCLTVAYLWCARKIGITPTVVGRELRGIGASVLVQAIVTAASFMAVAALGGTSLIASLCGAGLGVLSFVLALSILQPAILAECGALIATVVVTR